MKANLFERLEDLDTYLQNKKQRDVQVIFKSFVVGEKQVKGEKIYEIVDRFLVIER